MKEGEGGTERNPLSAINRIKDDFPRPEVMSREISSNRVGSLERHNGRLISFN